MFVLGACLYGSIFAYIQKSKCAHLETTRTYADAIVYILECGS